MNQQAQYALYEALKPLGLPESCSKIIITMKANQLTKIKCEFYATPVELDKAGNYKKAFAKFKLVPIEE